MLQDNVQVGTLRQNLRQAVIGGQIKVGQRLDSERDLAARYGIPRTTVSHVVSGLVEEGLLARQAGRAGTIVISNHPTRLRSGARQISCLMTHFRHWSPSDNYFYDLIRGAQYAAKEAGFSLNLWSPPDNASLKEALGEALEMCGGLVIVDEEFEDGVAAYLQEHFVRPIILNRPSNLAVDAVLADNVSGIGQVMDYLYKLGHRRIGYVGNPNDPNNQERERTFIDLSTRMGLNQVGHVLRMDVNSRKLAQVGLKSEEIALLEESKLTDAFLRTNTAIIGSNDYVSKGVLQKAKQMRINVPRDLSVVGFGSFALADQLDPKLTSVRIESDQIGRHAVRLFLDRLRDTGDRAAVVERIPVELHVRESCARAPER